MRVSSTAYTYRLAYGSLVFNSPVAVDSSYMIK